MDISILYNLLLLAILVAKCIENNEDVDVQLNCSV